MVWNEFIEQGWLEGGPGKSLKMKKKRLLFLILISLLIFGILTFFGEKGIFHLLRLRKELVRVNEKNFTLEAENQKLKEEVKRIRSDRRYIEEIARKELGMVKEGEIIYQFDSSNDKNSKDKKDK